MTDVSTSDNLVCYYKYRYTFASETTKSDQITKANQIVAELRKYMVEDKYTMGIEYYTKGMAATKPHMHVHFLSKTARATIREQLRTKFDIIGRNVQSIKPEVLVDVEKFWRYPLKQQKGESKQYSRTIGFTDEEIKHMIDVAYSCWKQAAEVAIAKQIKKEERSGKERLFAYLDTKTLSTLRECRIESYKYYAGYEESFSANTIIGYATVYALTKGIISYEDFDDLVAKQV